MHFFKGSLRIAGLLLVVPGWALAQTPPAIKPSESTKLVDSTQGPALFSAYCTVCHGWEGKGDGPLAKSLKVVPPDLTRISIRNGGRFPSDRIQRVISGQAALEKGHGTGDMPVWGPIFSQIAWDQDLGHVRIYNLTKYIEGLQKK
jgi:mono/diheme cytochrome c family protein